MAKYYQLTKEDVTAILESNAPDNIKAKIKKQSNPIKVRTAKAKGMGLQAEVAELISSLTGVPFLRGDDESLIFPRPSGMNGVDIGLRGEAKKLFPWSVECKNQETMNIVETVKQASANKMDGTEWLIYHRRKALDEDVVILSWSAFAKLFKRSK